MRQCRPSILARPVKNRGRANRESIDAQYEQEQSALRARQDRYNATVDFLRQSRQEEVKPGERQARFEEFSHIQEVQLAIKEEKRDQNRGLDHQTAMELLNLEGQAEQEENETKRAKREFALSVMDENRRLAELRKQRKADEREAEKRLENRNLELLSQQRHSYR